MTLRIQKTSDGDDTIVHLSGRLAAADREGLYEQIEGSRGRNALDLEEVTLVDIEIVGFLAKCEAEGMELLHCSPYIREWISRECDRATDDFQEASTL